MVTFEEISQVIREGFVSLNMPITVSLGKTRTEAIIVYEVLASDGVINVKCGIAIEREALEVGDVIGALRESMPNAVVALQDAIFRKRCEIAERRRQEIARNN